MLKKLLQYVEVKTKITCLLPFLMTLAFLFYLKQPVNLPLTAVFFGSMLLLDLAVTAINNYIDSRAFPEMLPFSRPAALGILLALLLSGTGLGLYLAFRTDAVVLLVGGLCALGGVLYTFGPVPISRLPLGEVFSGVLEGVCIPFLLLYINMPKDTFLSLRLSLSAVEFTLRPLPLLTLLLFMAVPALCTAGIMLANNICDLRRDVSVNRYTLPFFLGKSRAMRLFGILYLLAFLAPCLMVLLGWLPSACLLLFLLVPPVRKNLKAFQKEQRKDTTFHGAIRNYILLVGGYTVCLFLGGVLERVF